MGFTHAELIEMNNTGRVLIGIDRGFALRFYTYAPESKIIEMTGESIGLEKAIVWFGVVFGPLALLGSVACSFFAFGWLGILTLVVCPLVYLFFAMMSVRGGARLGGITVILLFAVVVHFWGGFPNWWATLFVVTFLFALWSVRSAYSAASFLLHCFVIRNERAFKFLYESSMIHLKFRGE